jgi:MSHA biogenesis protein MshN
MSLINQMLQELEQRKAHVSANTHPELKQTQHPLYAVATPRKRKLLHYAVLAALCVAGAYAMQWLSHPAMPKAKQMTSLPSASGVIAEANAHINSIATGALSPAQLNVPTPIAPEVSVNSQSAVGATLFAPSLEKTLHWSHGRGVLETTTLATAGHLSASKASTKSTPVMLAANATNVPITQAVTTEVTTLALANSLPKNNTVSAPAIEPKVSVNKTISAEQQAAHMYQQAIAYLQQGRVAEAQDQLKSGLATYPAHDDARQTLVGLLLDSNRHDEAMQVLKAGLQQSPNQIAYVQTLARLQLEAGLLSEALHTLESQAASNQRPQEYHALMAVVLQKTGRHNQAIQHYQQALSLGATIPAWYIGLGVSLQAEGREQEAKLAYQQAQASQLSPELALFVSQRLKQVQ